MVKALTVTTGQVVPPITTARVEAVRAVRDVTLALIQAPLFSMVGAFSLVELLQGVMVPKGRKERRYAGSHDAYTEVDVMEPLISQDAATKLEVAIVSTEVLKSLGGADIIGKLIPLLIK